MLKIEIHHPDGTLKFVEVPDDCVIGKGAQSEVRLDSWRIGKEHARLFITPSGVLIDDMGAFSGVYVNEQRIQGQYGPLRPSDVIAIGPFKLKVSESSVEAPSVAKVRISPPSLPSDRVPVVQENAARDGEGGAAGGQPSTQTQEQLGEPVIEVGAPSVEWQHRALEFEWRKRIHAALLETMDLRRHDVHSMSDERLRHETEILVQKILKDHEAEIPDSLDRELLCTLVLNEAIGLGPLEELLADDGVSEIMVNRFDEIYVERSGRLLRHPLAFTGDFAVMGVIERIVAPLGRRIDESSPMVDARLKDGSRVNAIIPPLALKGPCLTIRKFAKKKLSAQDLVTYGSMGLDMATFLEVCVAARKSIIVSGGTGSGKTTLLNILSNFIPSGERIITVEDAAELKLHHEHLISLEARPSNLEGKGAVAIRDLVKNTLRMRPDRIVVGECRGAEALDMLQAMNTGHEGSLTTLHANTPRDAMARLETMVLMAGMDLPLVAIREQIVSAVDIVVQQTRFACGSRKIVSITELTGIESGTIQMQELFRFHPQGYNGEGGKVTGFYTACDMVPGFYEDLQNTGAQLDVGIFEPAPAYRAVMAEQ